MTDERKKLDEIATELTGIKPIEDKEYQHISYERIPIKDGVRKIVQKRTKIFKTSRKRI